MTDTEALITQLVNLEARKADIDDLIAQTKAALIANRAPGDTLTYNGEPVYKVSQRRSFDAKIAEATLPSDVAAAATVAKIDGTALKRLSPALWESCCTLSEPFLTKARA